MISAAVGALLGAVLGQGPRTTAVVTGYAVVLGVGIDLDHFVIARIRTGSWAAARRFARAPVESTRDQSRIFTEDEVRRADRLVSHLLLGGTLVAGLAGPAPFWGLVTGVVLYAHVLADVLADAFGPTGRP